MVRNSNKGFTLVELLAVIVILGILIAVSIPAINTILSNARKDTMKNDAISIVEAVKVYRFSNGITGSGIYTISAQNSKTFTCNSSSSCADTDLTSPYTTDEILENALSNSPFGKAYTNVKVSVNNSDVYSVCLIDNGKNYVGAANLTNDNKVSIIGVNSITRASVRNNSLASGCN